MHSRTRIGPSAAAIGVAALIAFVAIGVYYQHLQAAASGNSAFDIAGPVVVGSNTTYKFTIGNQSTDAHALETVLLTSITGYPSCKAPELSVPLCATAANQDPGVFTPVGPHTGKAGTACAGRTFTVTVNAAGLWTFTPLAPAAFPTLQPSDPPPTPPSNDGGPLATCVIEGGATVNKLPADADPLEPGIQTQQLSDARGDTSTSQQKFAGLGTAVITVTSPPDIQTASNPGGGGHNPGVSVTDSVTVSGTPTPTGNVTFFLCQPVDVTAAGCEKPKGTQIGAVKALDAAGQATSDPTSAANTQAFGKYCWRVEYAGDAVFTAASHTNDGNECFTVEPKVEVQTTSNPTGNVAPGTSVTDSVTVTGNGTPAPTGDVTFFLCQPADVTLAGCPSGSGAQIGLAKTLDAAGQATSDATTNTTTPGKYCWRAEYAGDQVYSAKSHTNATTECFTVVDVTLATTSNPTGNVTPGTSVTDSVTVTGTGPTPTGNVTFFLCQPAAVTALGCPTGGDPIGAAKTLDAGGSATSDATTNTTTPGKYCWRAEYAGDSVYGPARHTNATTECFTVVPNLTLETTSNPTGGGVTPGASVTDSVTATGNGPVPTGNVTFFLCQPADVTALGCPTGGAQVGAAKALDLAGQATSDATTNTNTSGKYCWRVEYAGDAVYPAKSHTNAGTECFTVKSLPEASSVSNPTGAGVAPGTSVTDTVTISGTPTPTGTVTFFLCQPTAVTVLGCPTGGDQIGAAKALNAAGQATSDPTTNTTALGKYCWRTEYSGDANFLPARHTNATTECFTVEARRGPDLTVLKELKPGQPPFRGGPGGQLFYLVRVRNIGTVATPPPPFGVTLIDTPPAGTTITRWSLISGSGTCALDGAGRLVCSLGANMAPGEETVVEVVIRTPRSGTLTNTATVDPFNRIAETNEANNTATLDTVIP